MVVSTHFIANRYMYALTMSVDSYLLTWHSLYCEANISLSLIFKTFEAGQYKEGKGFGSDCIFILQVSAPHHCNTLFFSIFFE